MSSTKNNCGRCEGLGGLVARSVDQKPPAHPLNVAFRKTPGNGAALPRRTGKAVPQIVESQSIKCALRVSRDCSSSATKGGAR
jgi:hypothetical protein